MDHFAILEDAIKHLDFAPTTLEDQQQVEGALAAIKTRVAELEAVIRGTLEQMTLTDCLRPNLETALKG